MSIERKRESLDPLDRMIRDESPLRPEEKQKLMDALAAAALVLSQTFDGERS